jgi:hypothetical protein
MEKLIIRQAARQNQKLRLLLRGYAGSGKTYSALVFASELAKQSPDSQIFYIDTENGSSELYSADFNYQMIDYLENFGENFNPRYLIDVVKQIEGPNNIIVIDSLSHFWDGAGGMLELQELAGGAFRDWHKVNPLYQDFVNSIIRSKSHIVACSRTKTEYALLDGGKKIQKLGTKTVGREGLDYEFTTVLDMSKGGFATADKDRSSLVPAEGVQVDTRLAQEFIKWLSQGLPTTFYVAVDAIAKLYKITREEVLSGILKKYEVTSVSELTKDQVIEAQKTCEDNLAEAEKKFAEKRKEDEKALSETKMKEFFVHAQKFAEKHQSKLEEVKLWVKTLEGEDSMNDFTTDQLKKWSDKLKTIVDGAEPNGEFLLWVNTYRADAAKNPPQDSKDEEKQEVEPAEGTQEDTAVIEGKSEPEPKVKY